MAVVLAVPAEAPHLGARGAALLDKAMLAAGGLGINLAVVAAVLMELVVILLPLVPAQMRARWATIVTAAAGGVENPIQFLERLGFMGPGAVDRLFTMKMIQLR
jgi:hypothetical protein